MTTVAFVLNRPLNTGGQAIVCVLRLSLEMRSI